MDHLLTVANRPLFFLGLVVVDEVNEGKFAASLAPVDFLVVFLNFGDIMGGGSRIRSRV